MSGHLCVCLLRGVNVGGHGRLPMKALVSLCEGLGLTEVRTYVQSGNVVFRAPRPPSAALAAKLRAAIQAQHGFSPAVLLLSGEQFCDALDGNPFPEAEGKALHLYLLESVPPAPELAALTKLAGPNERFVLDGARFWLHAPDGIGRSKLAPAVERKLGVPATARNENTLRALRALLER